MRRVLYILNLDPSRKFGSLEEQIALLAPALEAESGLFLPLFNTTPGPESAAEFLERGIAVEGLNLLRFRLGTLRRLVGLVRRQRIDVIHWNFYDPVRNGYVWALSALLPGVRHYYTDHISRATTAAPPCSGLKRALKGVLFRPYEKVLCVSDYVRDDLQARVASSRIGRWHHFINTARFRPDPAERARRREEHGAGARLILLVVAQLHAGKGVDVALRALRALPESVGLWVVGEGDDQPRLQALCEEWSLVDRVRFLGVRRNVAPVMQAADVLVCPSLWAEAAGLVVLEAMGCGLPVVASRIGGIPEYVDDGKTGFVFPPGDDERLAAILKRLHDDPPFRHGLGQAARASAVANHAADRLIPETLNLYRTPEPRCQHAHVVRSAT